MNLFDILETLNFSDAALIFYCLLNRIPIIVLGEESGIVDMFLIELTEIVNFRKEYVFYRDFLSEEDYGNLISNEYTDYSLPRAHIRCPCSVSIKAINQLKEFDSWVIGFKIENDNGKLKSFITAIKKKMDFFLSILLFPNSYSVNLEFSERYLKRIEQLRILWEQPVAITHLVSFNLEHLDISLEKRFLQKISQYTNKVIAKMTNLFSEKVKSIDLNKDLKRALLDFENEENELKKSLVRTEIQNFVSSSKKAFFILSRLNLLRDLDYKINIESKTVLDIIDCHKVSIDRIIFFIYREWGENFYNIIENGKIK
ncbi:MAG: hypothetical protein ACFFBI_14230 [Promethearchaeota archaeon]